MTNKLEGMTLDEFAQYVMDKCAFSANNPKYGELQQELLRRLGASGVDVEGLAAELWEVLAANQMLPEKRNALMQSVWLKQFAAIARKHIAQPVAPVPVDGKFGILGDRLVNLVSGEPIPKDEPLFLLRARDHHALALLAEYLAIASVDCNDLHIAGIQQIIDRFKRFAAEHPERMKEPGKTRHLKLEPAPPEAEQEESK